MRHPRIVLSRDTISERVWGHDTSYGSNTLDVYVGYLRRKTEAGWWCLRWPWPARL